jgi:hypothetical protein
MDYPLESPSRLIEAEGRDLLLVLLQSPKFQHLRTRQRLAREMTCQKRRKWKKLPRNKERKKKKKNQKKRKTNFHPHEKVYERVHLQRLNLFLCPSQLTSHRRHPLISMPVSRMPLPLRTTRSYRHSPILQLSISPVYSEVQEERTTTGSKYPLLEAELH